jgi:hypothetical protein
MKNLMKSFLSLFITTIFFGAIASDEVIAHGYWSRYTYPPCPSPPPWGMIPPCPPGYGRLEYPCPPPFAQYPRPPRYLPYREYFSKPRPPRPPLSPYGYFNEEGVWVPFSGSPGFKGKGLKSEKKGVTPSKRSSKKKPSSGKGSRSYKIVP